MSSLIVGGVAIPVAPGSVKRDRLDMADRMRALDGTYRVSLTGNPKREWSLSTTPIPRGRADYFETVLASISAQACSGDVIGSNQLVHSDNMAVAPWGTHLLTATRDATDPFGTFRATRLTATGADAYVLQDLGAGSSAIRTNSVWIQRRIGTGTVQLYAPDGSTNIDVTATINANPGFNYFQVAGGASTSRRFEIDVRTSGDEVAAYNPQLEDGATATTYSETGATGAGTVSCFSEITSWTPISKPSGHYVVIDFALHEA